MTRASRARHGREQDQTTPTSTMNAPSATTCAWSTSRGVIGAADAVGEHARPRWRVTTPRRRAAVAGRRRSRGRIPLIAAIGGTRAARTAGSTAAATVTTTPTSSETTTVRRAAPSTCRGGRARARGAARAARSRGRCPTTNPIADATIPTTNASSTTDRTTCLPVAPIARSKPELTRALRDEDRERVEDDERADHHADRGEPEQRVREVAEELPHRLADPQRGLVGLEHVEPGPEGTVDPGLRAPRHCTPGSRCT